MKKAIVFIIVALFLVSFVFAAYGPGKAPGTSTSSGSSSSSSSGGGGGGGGRGVGGVCATGYTKVDGVCVKTESEPASSVEEPEAAEQVPAEAVSAEGASAETVPAEAAPSQEAIVAGELDQKGAELGWLWATLAVVAIGGLIAVYINIQKR